MIYRFRVILDNDTEDDIFRDIEIYKTNSLEEFHETIINSFGFINNEMASFYISDNEWNQLSDFFTTEILNHSGDVCIVIEEVGWSLLPNTSSGLLFSERLTMLSQSLYKYSTQSWLVLNGRAIDIQTYGILIP